MNKALTIALGILAVLTGLCALHAADPDPKEVTFEGKPVRSWLEEFRSPKAEEVLRRLCAKPEKAVPALTAALADKNKLVRIAAAECLGYYFEKNL